MNFNFNNNGNNNIDLVSLLQKLPYFRGLKKNELREFSRIIYVRWYKKNETIFYENEPGIGMYIIYKGSVKIFKKSALNGREMISTLIRGDFFGELSLLEKHPRSFTATALEDSCLLGIFRPELLRFLERKPRLGNKIILKFTQLITTRLQQKNEELIEIKDKLANSDIIL